MRSILLRRWLGGVLLLCWGVALAFEEPAFKDPVGELTLGQAMQAALARNPELAAAAYTLKISDAQVRQSGMRANPSLSFEFEDFLGTGAVSGVRAMQSTLSLSQVIELGDKRVLRVGVAHTQQQLDEIDYQAQQLDVLAEVARRFIAVASAQETLALTQRMVALSEQTLQTMSARVQAGRSPEAERSQASVALLRAQLEQQQRGAQLQAARRLLAAAWAGSEPKFTRVSADLFHLPVTRSFVDLQTQLRMNPDILRFASTMRVRQAELRLLQAQAKPTLNVNVGLRRLEASDDTALVAGISMPLRIFDRNQDSARATQLRIEQVAAQQQAAQINAEAVLFGLYQALQDSRLRMTTLREQVLPQAQQMLEQIQYGYERGRFSYLELLTAQRELVELQAAAIEAAVAAQRHICEIERLTGAPLVTP